MHSFQLHCATSVWTWRDKKSKKQPDEECEECEKLYVQFRFHQIRHVWPYSECFHHSAVNLKAATCIVTETDTKEEAKHFYQPLLGDKVHRKWDATDAFWPFKPQWHLKARIACNKIYVVVRNSEVWRDLNSVLIQSNTSLCFCSTNSGVFPHQLICQQTDGCGKTLPKLHKVEHLFYDVHVFPTSDCANLSN